MAKRRGGAARVGVIVLEAAGMLLAVVAGATAFLYWRLHSGPVSLSFALPALEYVLGRAVPPGLKAEIGEAALARGSNSGEYRLALERIVITQNGQRVAELPLVTAAFSLRAAWRDGPRPISINVASPFLTIERPAGGSIVRLPQAGFVGAVSRLSALDRLDVTDATIRYSDQKTGQHWSASGARVALARRDAGFHVQVFAEFETDAGAASLEADIRHDAGLGDTHAELSVANAPLGDILQLAFGQRAFALSAPVSGSAFLTLGPTGEIRESRFTAAVGQGVAAIGERTLSVVEADLEAHFEAERKAFMIDRMFVSIGGVSATLAGEIGLGGGPGEAPALSFDLIAESVVIDADGVLTAPLVIERLASRGAFDYAERRLSVDELRAELLGVVVSGEIDLATPANMSPAIDARLSVDGALDRDSLLLAWPIGRAQGARDFVEFRMPSGEARNVAFEMSLPAGALAAGAMPDDAMTVTFDIADAIVIYAPTMTPLTGVQGSARLTGDRLVASVERARAGAVRLDNGEVDFTELSRRGAPSYFRFRASGEARDVLAVLDEPPLEVLRLTPFEAARFSGKVSGQVEIMRPNQRDVGPDEYRYSGVATFVDAGVSDIYGSADLSAGQGRIAFDTVSMVMTGDADIGGAPIQFEWTQKLRQAEERSSFVVSGSLDNAAGDLLGLPTRQVIRGVVPFTARASGDFASLKSLEVAADFTQADLSIDLLGWTKPAGAPANGAIDIVFEDDALFMRSLSVAGHGVTVAGTGSLRGGAIQHLDIREFRLTDAADLTVSARRTGSGALDLAMTGRLLDVGPAVKSLLEESSGPRDPDAEEQSSLILRSRIDEVRLRNGVVYRDVALDFQRHAAMIEALSLSARTASGSPLTMRLDQTGADDGPSQTIAARSDDMGALLSGLFGVSSIRGGVGSLHVNVSPAQRGAFGFSGTLTAKNFQVVNAPILARVFAAGSLNGLVDLLNGEGVTLTRAFAEFEFHSGVMTIADARAAGPSVGITASGSIGAGERGGVNLSGAIAPAYGVNSFLGHAPLIGDLFVNRAGEGVVALAYTVSGPSDGPTVAINPLSALTPGVFRRIFERERQADADGVE